MEKEGVIVIGGSAGSIEVVINLLPHIPENFPYPIVIVLHRKSTVEYHLEDVLNRKCKLKVCEIHDKMKLEGNKIYLVPGDYHLLVDNEGYLCLDYSEKVNYSRPSIDVTFDSFAKTFGQNCLGILLSGANADGAIGLKRIKNSGGITIVQNPGSATVPTMPLAALSLFKPDLIADVLKMIGVFSELNQLTFLELIKKLNQGEEIESNLPSVLIVDDLEDNLFTLNALLKSEPLIIHKANSGQKAIDMAIKHTYDCIILDVQMPEMDGFEAAKILNENELTKNIPIIFLSALGSDKEKVIQGIDSGAIDFIAKPPDPSLLKAKVKLCINISKKTKQSRKVLTSVKKERDTFKDFHYDFSASMRYAKNIQQALLPSKEVFNSIFKQNFILYQPKESIGGDFYYIKETDDEIVLICGDCTGHGVPGAMMTMISISIVNNLVETKGITQPDRILNEMIKEFKKAFSSEFSTITIEDGLELAICTFQKKENILQYSGAGRAILLKQENQLKKIEPNHFGISGTMSDDINYHLKTFYLNKDDVVYLYTDGIIDQFGGPKGKKFMTRRLIGLMNTTMNKPMDDQLVEIKDTIHHWMGELEQIDDILVIGIRL